MAPGRLLPRLERPLSEGEAVAFREDLRAADQEVQSYFRLYYIVGLIGVAAWLVSPEVKPIRDLMLGNDGYNIFVPIIIALLNSVSSTYLLQKSIEIHEIAQFISYASEPKSGFLGWEKWRRSKASVSQWPRRLYAFYLTAVPLGVSFVLICASWRVVHASVESLVPTSFSKEEIESVSAVLWVAKRVLYGVIGLHVIPLVLIYFNLVRVPRLWTNVLSKHATKKPEKEATNIDGLA